MGDIFDDVMAMESADLAAATETIDGQADSNFNASELDDIMAEIDNLEKDFISETEVASLVVAKAEVLAAPEAIQEVVSEPITEVVVEAIAEVVSEPIAEVAAETITEVVSEPVAEVAAEIIVKAAPERIAEVDPAPTVLAFEKKPIPVAMPAPLSVNPNNSSNVSLSASGNMGLSLTFKIGDEDATLVIDQEKGLLVSFQGVELSLHAEKGCCVEMANGVSFSVPVQSGASASKKKSA
jgi:hypothetical protein